MSLNLLKKILFIIFNKNYKLFLHSCSRFRGSLNTLTIDVQFKIEFTFYFFPLDISTI